MKSRQPKAPSLVPIEELAISRAFKAYDEDLYTNAWVRECSASRKEARHVVVEGSVFELVDLTETRYEKLDLSDVSLRKCDLANVAWDEFEARRVVFEGCRLLGAKFIEGVFKDVRFNDCHAQFAQMRYGTLAGAWFSACDLRDADFSGADLTGATFEECNLTGASFLNAKCGGVDIRSSSMERLQIGPTELRGLVVTPIQAIQLAAVFGLRVLNEFDDIDAAPIGGVGSES
ncbi:MAG TPA: pentapeptide repeat-containing protein [Capsulimonadaceae bacterium]|jgi:uncharacterized protein YjbI with pentapeptide repeats